ncbi:MAG: signal peptidase I [Carnobacterium maltaromaticum]
MVAKKRGNKKKPASTKREQKKALKQGNHLMTEYNQWLAKGYSLEGEMRETVKNPILPEKYKDYWNEIASQTSKHVREGQRLKGKLRRSRFLDPSLLEDPMRQPLVAKKKNWIESFVFYGIIVVVIVLISTLFSGPGDSGVPRNIMGYAPLTVLTKSMHSVYPKDSFLLIQVEDSKKLTIGDDITFLKENNTTVTHRIIGIQENFENQGQRGFETKGVDNPLADEDIVIADNVIGKVIYSNYTIGRLLLIVRNNLLMVAVLMIVSIFFLDALITLIKSYRKTKY